MNLHDDDARWMRRCEDLARQAAVAGNTPVGAVVVIGAVAVGEAAEEAPRGPRAFAHAELLAVETAIRTMGRQHLDGATLYSSAEPCLLCGFAIRESQIARVVIGRASGDIGSVRGRFAVLTAEGIDGWNDPPPAVWWYKPA
jgi:tRNA(adenine34) deaminase